MPESPYYTPAEADALDGYDNFDRLLNRGSPRAGQLARRFKDLSALYADTALSGDARAVRAQALVEQIGADLGALEAAKAAGARVAVRIKAAAAPGMQSVELPIALAQALTAARGALPDEQLTALLRQAGGKGAGGQASRADSEKAAKGRRTPNLGALLDGAAAAAAAPQTLGER